MKALLRALYGPVAFVAVFAMIVTAIVTVAPHHARRANRPSACVDAFVASLRAQRSLGVWECLDAQAQAAYYTGKGWKGDADVTTWFQAQDKSGATLDVTLFPGNPVPVCANSQFGPICRPSYLIYVTPILADGTRDTADAAGLTIILDGSGLIATIQ